MNHMQRQYEAARETHQAKTPAQLERAATSIEKKIVAAKNTLSRQEGRRTSRVQSMAEVRTRGRISDLSTELGAVRDLLRGV